MECMSEYTSLISSYQLLITTACTNTGDKMKGSNSRAADQWPFVLGHSLSQVTSFMQLGKLWNSQQTTHTSSWSFYQIHKIVGCTCARNAWNIFLTTDFKGNHWLAIPACIRGHAWRTCPDACWDHYHIVAGKMFPAFLALVQPSIYYISGKRLIPGELLVVYCQYYCTLKPVLYTCWTPYIKFTLLSSCSNIIDCLSVCPWARNYR